MYKRNGFYYLFAPAGGVATGWQVVLRSKSVYGPYERRVVMEQGNTSVNGPHQGAWINTQTGEDWFLHFQDKGMIGRVVHLQPMKWIDGWSVIGEDKKGDGTGYPVEKHRKPNVGATFLPENPVESDEFESKVLGLQWQWQANPQATWSFMNSETGTLRMYAQPRDEDRTLWDTPNVLLQKFPNDTFTATTKLTFTPVRNIPERREG